MATPRVFIASSAENIDIANAIQVNLDHESEPTVWKDGFDLSSSILEKLLEHANSVDFAVFVFTPDDVVTIREKSTKQVRDNVLFELGVFINSLGIYC